LKYSTIYPKTKKEDPKSISSPGTKLLIRGGFIEQISSGLWVMSTLGLLVRKNIEKIIRKEMNTSGAVEFEFPILQPKELWEESGRWSKYIEAGIAFKLKDRKNLEYFLAPTAEEVVTNFAKKNLRSYRDLPLNIWQINTKFRDEIRPRQGLIRSREFLMKDAYSFNESEESLSNTYSIMEKTYNNIFKKIGLNFIKVDADSGSIGGNNSSEFMGLTDVGEDTLIYCPKCNYGANQEKATVYFPEYPEEELCNLIELETPNIKTVEELCNFTKLPANKMIKTIILEVDGYPVIVSLRGDLEISEIKLANLLGATNIKNATPEIVEKVTKAPVGFAGPVGLYNKTDVKYFFDISAKGIKNFLCGGNKKDYHYINVNFGRDFLEPETFYDLSKAVTGEICSNCKEEKLNSFQGIEVGHIFQLGQVYSKPMNAKFIDNTGNEEFFYMGCYGIGVSRIVQTIAEQYYDKNGVIWPVSIAPFEIIVLPANNKYHLEDSFEIYKNLISLGFKVIIDDTDTRIGEKFANAELLGIPVQVVVGKSWQENKSLEIRWRNRTCFAQNIFSIEKENSLPSCKIEFYQLKDILEKIFAK